VKIEIPTLKNCLVYHDRFKRHILWLELKTVEKIRCPRKRIFKPVRDESYMQLVFLEEKIEGRRSETYIAADVVFKLGESKMDKAFTQHKHNKYSVANKNSKAGG